jgi:hypothetical protein
MDDVYSAGATTLEPKLGSGARVACGRIGPLGPDVELSLLVVSTSPLYPLPLSVAANLTKPSL